MSSPYIGEIRMFAGNFAPAGWALCQGQLLVISQYDTLFSLIGTTYGGDGQNTFALPDLQSRVPLHAGPGFVLAQAGGAEAVTLTTQQIPAHSHVPVASTNAAGASNPTGKVWAASPKYPEYAAAPDATVMAQSPTPAIGLTGGSQPHDNMVPFLVINFIISLFGIYPTPT